MLKHFHENYETARAHFLKVAEASGYKIETYTAPDGLFLDVAYYLPEAAEKILVTNSGTHGTEGLYGSAVQSAWLEKYPTNKLKKNLGVVFIHALNPYGVYHVRRVNEDNIDINRNFIDFNQTLPVNKGYGDLADALVSKNWFDKKAREKANAFLAAEKAKDKAAYLKAVFGGQYTHPKGLFWGGDHAAWSNITFKHILEKYLSQAKAIAFIDLHTGYGRYKQVEVYSISPEESEHHQRVSRWYENTTSTVPSPYPVSGSVAGAVHERFPKKCVCGVVIECGTSDDGEEPTLQALRADHALHEYGDLQSEDAHKIKHDVKEAFYVSDPDWRKTVGEVSLKILEDTVRGLIN